MKNVQSISKGTPDTNRPHICIVQPKIGRLTETFIEAHHRHLGRPISRLACDPFPTHTESGDPLFFPNVPKIHRLVGRVIGLDPIRSDRVVALRCPRRWQTRYLAHHFESTRVAVVLAEYGPTGVAVHQACRSAGIPLVVHFHGYDAYFHDVLREHHEDYRRLLAEAAAVIAVSKHMHQQLISLGASGQNVIYNPYGIDVKRFRGATPESNPALFIAVGRLVEKKAPDLTIRAFAKAHDAYPESKLIMVGEGPLTARCTRLISELKLEEAVELAGPRSHDEVAGLMSTARCLVQHSVTPPSGDREGTPLAILEAMASGLPIVSTRHGGIVDVVTENTTGFLVDEGDVDGMAEAIARLADSKDLAAELGRAGREYVIREHLLANRISILDDVLLRAANRAP